MLKWTKDNSLLRDKKNQFKFASQRSLSRLSAVHSYPGLDFLNDIMKISASSMMQIRPTFTFANIMKIIRTYVIIPFPIMDRRIHFSTFLIDAVRFPFIPVSVRGLCSINPYPARFVLGISVQTNPCPMWYFGDKCLLFSLWLYHGKRRSQCFTGGFCGIPVQGIGWDLVARTLHVEPVGWTNSLKKLMVVRCEFSFNEGFSHGTKENKYSTRATKEKIKKERLVEN